MTAVAAIRRAAFKLALVGIAAAAAIALALFHDGVSVIETVGVVLAIVPPAILVGFWFVVGELLALPARLRQMPQTMQSHVEHFGALARGRRPRVYDMPRVVWQLARFREDVTVYAPILPLLSIPFLAGVVAAAAAVVVEAIVAVIVVIVALS